MMAGNQAVVVVSEPVRVAIRLQALGLSEPVLRTTFEKALSSVALCSIDHPANWGGLTLWAEGTRWLRDGLRGSGWKRDNTRGLPTCVRGDDGMAIAIVRGNELTGNPDPAVLPTTQYKRGQATIDRIEENGVLPYDHLPAEYFERTGADAPPPTWLLMHHKRGGELLCELSFPTRVNSSGFVEKWGERIVLTSIPLDPNRLSILDDEPINPDVDVRRRA
jgi:hypothetical protein